MAKQIFLKDKDGTQMLPYTRDSMVLDSTGNSVIDRLPQAYDFEGILSTAPTMVSTSLPSAKTFFYIESTGRFCARNVTGTKTTTTTYYGSFTLADINKFKIGTSNGAGHLPETGALYRDTSTNKLYIGDEDGLHEIGFHDNATTSAAGLMSATDKTNLNKTVSSVSLAKTATGTTNTISVGANHTNSDLTSATSSISLSGATASAAGLVTTGTQTFAGAKTFSGAVTASSTMSVKGILSAPKSNLITNSNCFRFIPSGFNTSVHFNDTACDGSSAKVTGYYMNNAAGGYATVYATSFSQQTSSDSRLKDVQEQTQTYCDKLLSLGDVFDYKYNDVAHARTDQDYDEDVHTGLSYQNVKEVLPTACGEDNAGYGYINYISPDYVNLLAGALQEAIKEIKTLKAEIEELKNGN